MKFRFGMILFWGIVIGGTVLTRPLYAADYRTHWIDDKPKPEYTMWRKAGRGLVNVFLGWTEIAYQPVRMAEEGNRWPVALGGGLVRGVCYTIGRTLTGVYEIISFPVAIPLNYRPIIYPEYVIPPEKKVKLIE